MKNIIKLVCMLISTLIIFSSCQSIYEIPVETTAPPEGFEIDSEQEYYTLGYPYRSGNVFDGILYEGCLIYIEKVPSTGIIGYKGAEKTPVYGDTTVERIVKYNPVTGVASSPCLNPSCNHSLESDCPLVFTPPNVKVYGYTLKGVFGDWLIIWEQYRDEEYENLYKEKFYNLKTGEVRIAFDDELDSEVLVRWNGGAYYNGKYYRVKQILDYTGTGYKPGEGISLKNYKPVTTQYLYEYDFETNTSSELFKVQSDCNICKISNEKFYFVDDLKNVISYSKDGATRKRETSMDDMGTSNMLGTYTFYFTKVGYIIHDRKTDEKKDVVFDYTLTNIVCVTENGILSDHQTAYDEWKNFSAKEYRTQHPKATSKEVNAASRKILGAGTAQIWKCGFMGEDPQVIFELKNAFINTIAAQGDYIFATVERYDPETGDVTANSNGARCVINIKTGEITEIPFLDIVIPDDYINN